MRGRVFAPFPMPTVPQKGVWLLFPPLASESLYLFRRYLEMKRLLVAIISGGVLGVLETAYPGLIHQFIHSVSQF